MASYRKRKSLPIGRPMSTTSISVEVGVRQKVGLGTRGGIGQGEDVQALADRSDDFNAKAFGSRGKLPPAIPLHQQRPGA